jgi:hypothetical protein
MKKFLKIVGLTILILILFRGFIYRLVIEYKEIGTRIEIEITNEYLIQQIENKTAAEKMNLEKIVNISNEITNETLKFTINKASNDPNELMNLNKANCIGYSAMFNSIANYLIRKNNLEHKFRAKHKIGELRFLGINIHQFFDNPFFKDHDFNEIIDKETKEIISIDPSVSDFFWIRTITEN